MVARYRLAITEVADRDLDNIYVEGFEKWGEPQADSYYLNIIKHFELLCDNPFLFPTVDDVRPGYRRSVCGKHSVYYRIVDSTVEISALVKYDIHLTVILLSFE